MLFLFMRSDKHALVKIFKTEYNIQRNLNDLSGSLTNTVLKTLLYHD